MLSGKGQEQRWEVQGEEVNGFLRRAKDKKEGKEEKAKRKDERKEH